MCWINQKMNSTNMEHMNKLICMLKLAGISDYEENNVSDKNYHGTTDLFRTRKGVRQGWILSPCLFNLYAEYILRNVGLDEAQAGIKTARRDISNLRYADDTTLQVFLDFLLLHSRPL